MTAADNREVKNALAIEGIIDQASREIRASNSGDTIHALLVGLVHTAVDRSFAARSSAPAAPTFEEFVEALRVAGWHQVQFALTSVKRDLWRRMCFATPQPPADSEQAPALDEISLLYGVWPIIALGQGLIEVAEGHQDGTPALIFGRNGSGVIGAPTQPDREHLPGETLAVVTFSNVASLDVVAGKLAVLRTKLAATEPATPLAGSTFPQPVDEDTPHGDQYDCGWRAGWNDALKAVAAAEIIAAAQAVVERWDTPLWKDVPATADYINRLRAALAQLAQGD